MLCFGLWAGAIVLIRGVETWAALCLVVAAVSTTLVGCCFAAFPTPGRRGTHVALAVSLLGLASCAACWVALFMDPLMFAHHGEAPTSSQPGYLMGAMTVSLLAGSFESLKNARRLGGEAQKLS